MMRRFFSILSFCFSSFFCFAQSENERAEIVAKTDIITLQNIARHSKAKYERDLELLNFMPNTRRNNNFWFSGFDADGNPIFNMSLSVDSLSANFIKASALNSGGELSLDLNGENMIAGVWDTPIIYSHPAFEGRAIKKDSTSNYSDWHGSHITGIIIGSKQWISHKGRKAMGIADKAKVWGYDSAYEVDEVADAASNGLLVSNHSYGSQTSRHYTSLAQSYDNIMVAAPYYIAVFANGNENHIPFNMNHYGISKNSISVANCNQGNNYTGPSSVVSNPLSSYGPTADLRIKPDITAVGDKVLSASYYIPEDDYDGTSKASGTSMSAPGITGSILLLQQLYKAHNLSFMRGATAKALLINSATEAGLYAGPDIAFGWGLADVKGAANMILQDGAASSISEATLTNNESRQIEIIASGNEPLVATLTWADPSAIPSADNSLKLINDLDLRISSASITHLPWKLDSATYSHTTKGDYIAAIKGDNIRDNVEKIEILDPIAGQAYNLSINHKAVLTGGDQKYSLVISGLMGCVSTRNIETDIPANSTNKVQALNTIISSNTLNVNSQVIYHAGEEVVMENGFSAIEGSVFRAYIEGCSSEYNARKGNIEFENVAEQVSMLTEEPNTFVLFPNPTTGKLNVDVSEFSKGGLVNVFSSYGKLVYSSLFKSVKNLVIEMTNEPSGLYLIQVSSEGKVYNKKLIKK